jgi:glycosyltransferase involved in cell wall biosynthesis
MTKPGLFGTLKGKYLMIAPLSQASCAISTSKVPAHVLVVCNHWGAKTSFPSAGIFIERQIASLERAGLKISTFDLGRSHAPMHILKKWLELRELVRRLNPDIVHGRRGTIVGFLAAFAGKPAVITYDGADLLRGESVPFVRQRLGFLLSNIAALKANRLICVSEELRQALWWRKNRAAVIPDGVDLNLFSPGSQAIAREQLGWDVHCPIVIWYPGDDPRAKGLHVVKAAIQKVQSQVPGTELRLIENVEPSSMPLYYRAADVLLCACLVAGSPNVVKEALACNLPVVSTPVADVPERLVGVQPSAVVANDAEAVAEALMKVLLERNRSNGREHVARLSEGDIAQRVLEVYRTALDQETI